VNENIRFTVKNLAIYLGCGESSIRKLTREHELPHFRIGAKIIYTKQDIDEWIKNNTLQKSE
jgi:excisionase family DNA binding protein